MAFTFPKKDRLTGQKLIEKVFSEGKAITVFPIRVVYTSVKLQNHDCVQAGFTVPKRNFKKAVTRNRIKRLMRESYRLHKPSFFNNSTTSYAFMFLYLGKKVPDFEEIHQCMESVLNQVSMLKK